MGFLILRNILRIAAVSMVADFVIRIGKLVIPLGTTLLAYIIINATLVDDLYGIWGPLGFTFLMSWFTALMFCEVYGMAIWTTLQCYIADEEMFGTPMFAGGSLKKTIKETNDKAGDGVVQVQ